MAVMKTKTTFMSALRVTTDSRPPGTETYQMIGTAFVHQLNVLVPGVTNGNHKLPNAHSWTIFRRGNYFGTVSTFFKNGSIQQSGASGTQVQGKVPPSYAQTAAYNRALSKMFDQVRTDIDLSVALAEHASTRRMLRSSLRVVDTIRRIHPKHWHKNWLEYQYGWRPLVNDVYKSLDELTNVAREYSRAVGTATERGYSLSLRPNMWGITGFDSPEWNAWTQRERISALYRLEPSFITKIGNWSSLNPATIAWELLPYSFVIDWFIDVGGYLRNLETAFMMNQKFYHGYRTSTYKSLTTGVSAVGKERLPTQPGVHDIVDMKGWDERKSKNRTVLGSSIIPTLPHFHARLGATRMLSAAALLATFLEPKKNRGRHFNRINQVMNQKFNPPTWDEFRNESPTTNRNEFNDLKRPRPRLDSRFWSKLK